MATEIFGSAAFGLIQRPRKVMSLFFRSRRFHLEGVVCAIRLSPDKHFQQGGRLSTAAENAAREDTRPPWNGVRLSVNDVKLTSKRRETRAETVAICGTGVGTTGTDGTAASPASLSRSGRRHARLVRPASPVPPRIATAVKRGILPVSDSRGKRAVRTKGRLARITRMRPPLFRLCGFD